MNKSELIEAVSVQTGLPKAKASAAVEAILDTIKDALKHHEKVSLAGFGTFSIRSRAARQGRNPSTGEMIRISAGSTPSFKAAKSLREQLRGSRTDADDEDSDETDDGGNWVKS